MTAVLDCRDLHAGYGESEVLTSVSVALAPGDIYALMGKNGAGKTTFFLTLLGVINPTAGSVNIFGQDVSAWAPYQIAALGVGCAPQENAFFQDLTVSENLRLGCLGLTRHAFNCGRDRVVEMFPFIGDRLRQKAGTLSGGEQAMVKVARVLLPEPRLVLLDEVTEGLQPLTVNRVRDVLVRDHQARNTTLLVIEQNVAFAARLATRFGLMDRGCIVGEGSFCESDATARIATHLSV